MSRIRFGLVVGHIISSILWFLPGSIPQIINEIGNGIYYRQDDMIISRLDLKSGVLGTNWPDGVLPYMIDSTILDQPELLADIYGSQEDISKATCISFREAGPNDTYWIKYRINPWENDCSSYVGFLNIPNQDINLNPGCTRGHIIHETLHALGFLHEQTRRDRDDYVVIRYDNIIQSPNFSLNFLRDDELGYETDYYSVPYNYESIMHYPPNAFSVNESDPERNTIQAVIQQENSQAIGDPTKMGQSKRLTEADIKMIRNKYACPPIQEKPDPDENIDITGEPEGNTTELIEPSHHSHPSDPNVTHEAITETGADASSQSAEPNDPSTSTTVSELLSSASTLSTTSEVAEEPSPSTFSSLTSTPETVSTVIRTTTVESITNEHHTTSTTQGTGKPPVKPPPHCTFPIKPPFC